MATPPNCGPDPFTTVPNQSNENVDPNHNDNNAFRTPLTSPTKFSVPTTPPQPNKSTPLYRRFLKEVTMSPATPPRSPSPTKSRSSPPKRGDSPTKGRDSPTKLKLEVGQNGFHFTCEIPESKIVPNKPKKDVSTPRSRTPSPTKMDSAKVEVPSRAATPVKGTPSERTSPAKQIPSRPPFGSPLVKKEIPGKPTVRNLAVFKSSATRNGLPRKSAHALSHTPRSKTTTPTPNKHVDSARTSPTRAIKMETKLVEGVSTPRKDSKDVQDVAEAEVAEAEVATSVHVVAATPTSTGSPRPPLNATGQTPTRIRRGASFDIGDMMKGLRLDASKSRPEVVERVGEANISEPPTPLRKAAEVIQPIVSIAELRSKTDGALPETVTETVPILLAEPVTEIRFTSPFKIPEQTLQYRPLLFPRPDPEATEDERSPAKKHVKFDKVCDSFAKKSSRPVFARTSGQSGTDQDIMLAMQQEMDVLKLSLSNSLGVDFRFSKGKEKENTFELPVMANSTQGLESNMPAATRPKRALLRTTSEVSNTSNSTTHSSVRASMFMHPKRSPSKLPTPQLKVPKWPYASKTPVQARREQLTAAKVDEHEDHKQLNNAHRNVPASASPMKTAPACTTNKAKAPSLTPRNRSAKLGTPARANVPVTATPSRSRTTPGAPTTRSKPLTTPAKPRFGAGNILQGARKSVFGSPAPNKTSTPVSRTKTPRPATAARPPSGPTLNSDGIPIPKFASAQAIAGRIAEWNSEDRKKAAMGTPRKPDPTPSKRRKMDSTTPKDSPAKQESNTPKTSPTKPSRLVPPKVKSLALTPKRPAPATPQAQNKALARLRGAVPSTPASRALDPNAYRTPSKEIESSLDAAIDRKIEEDARAGKVFTPGGNRVGVLIEARKWR
ncbi:hypothetical protein HBH70_018460 [Parastagonospora nodorum]|nr:hypothetical protein HBH70_018460 [Parastagonospora nodorum]KAH5798200.1 hypothetical protein HBI97_007440 [Parastagonospora nodorum]KAH5833504.1 hypothetical protein HBI94_023910 [Parastagonospora nodorum]KAH5842036.1 hypothetical protein HBI93_015800 [Parastagonospora nodorum]KAH5843663.1 hypothetical protein HBI96_005390 [Parastagonospora nodorum]